LSRRCAKPSNPGHEDDHAACQRAYLIRSGRVPGHPAAHADTSEGDAIFRRGGVRGASGDRYPGGGRVSASPGWIRPVTKPHRMSSHCCHARRWRWSSGNGFPRFGICELWPIHASSRFHLCVWPHAAQMNGIATGGRLPNTTHSAFNPVGTDVSVCGHLTNMSPMTEFPR
jgi:hypothetical protein